MITVFWRFWHGSNIPQLSNAKRKGLGEDATCKQCGKVLGQDIESEEVIAREIKGKREVFCSNECADKYEKEQS